jgi:hypothetical protein
VGKIDLQTATSSSEKPFGARGGEGEAVMHAVGQYHGCGNVMGIAGSLQRRDDVVGVVGRVGQPGEEPPVETMGFGERRFAARVRAALMRIDMFAAELPKFPDAGVGGALGMPQLDRARRPVDGNAASRSISETPSKMMLGSPISRASPRIQSRIASDRRKRSFESWIAGSDDASVIFF